MKVCVSEPVFTTAFGDPSYWLGKKGGGNRSVRWGEDRPTTGLLQLKTFSSGKMSNNWDTATEEVERWKNKKRDPLEEMKAFLMRALRLFFLLTSDPQGLEWQRHANAAVQQVWERVDAREWVNVNDECSENTSRYHPLHTQLLWVSIRRFALPFCACVCVCACARACGCVCVRVLVTVCVCAREVKPVSQWEAKVRLRATKIWLISIFRASDEFPKEDGSMRWGWYNYVNVIFIEGRDFSF